MPTKQKKNTRDEDFSGARVKEFRELIGLKRPDFCEITGWDLDRLKNIEYARAKMNEDEFRIIKKYFPEFLEFVIDGTTLDIDELEKSEQLLCQLLAKRLREKGE